MNGLAMHIRASEHALRAIMIQGRIVPNILGPNSVVYRTVIGLRTVLARTPQLQLDLVRAIEQCFDNFGRIIMNQLKTDDDLTVARACLLVLSLAVCPMIYALRCNGEQGRAFVHHAMTSDEGTFRAMTDMLRECSCDEAQANHRNVLKHMLQDIKNKLAQAGLPQHSVSVAFNGIHF